MAEKWIQWKPIKGLAHNYCIYEVRESILGFSVVLAEVNNHSRHALITFENFVSAYRSTSEGFRQKTIESLDQGGYEENFYTQWSLFMIENSQYLRWLSEESYTVTDSLPLKHYAFITPDEILDIAAMSQPRVTLIENDQY